MLFPDQEMMKKEARFILKPYKKFLKQNRIILISQEFLINIPEFFCYFKNLLLKIPYY